MLRYRKTLMLTLAFGYCGFAVSASALASDSPIPIRFEISGSAECKGSSAQVVLMQSKTFEDDEFRGLVTSFARLYYASSELALPPEFDDALRHYSRIESLHPVCLPSGATGFILTLSSSDTQARFLVIVRAEGASINRLPID